MRSDLRSIPEALLRHRAKRVAFVAVASAVPALESEISRWRIAAETWLERGAAALVPAWELEFIGGKETPWAESGEICDHVKHRLVHEADFLVVLNYRGSTGCGRLISWAADLGLPILVLIPEGFDTSPLGAASAATESPVEACVIRVGDWEALRDGIRRWLHRNRERIAESEDRRYRPLRESEPVRMACAETWRRLRSDQRESVAERVRAPRATIVRMLRDPFEFTWASRDLRTRVIDELAPIVPTAGGTVGDVRLPAEVVVALHDAISEYLWTRDEVNETRQAGLRYERDRIGLELAGAKLRKPALTNRKAWKWVRDEFGSRARAG